MELANFPRISQRDGDINSDDDCVPGSIADCLTWLTGRHYSASQIKDAVYGVAYVGGTAAERYVAYCADQGVLLAYHDGNGQALVSALKEMIAAGHPCLITEPDPYEDGWSHVCAAYKFDDSSITVMDPWINQPVTKSDAEWASELEFNQIWYLEKKERTTWMSGFQQDQASKIWRSTTKGARGGGNVLDPQAGIFEAGKTPPSTTGIAKSWEAEYMNGRNRGAPTSYEYSEVDGKQLTDWNGEPIARMDFQYAWCEWNIKQSVARWYS